MSDQSPALPEKEPKLPPEQGPEELFGYSPEQLQRMGMGFLLEPPREQTTPIKPLSTGLRIDPDEPLESIDDEPPSAMVIELPASTAAVQPIPAPAEVPHTANPEKTQKRRKGGQPGNLNAFKHGLYLEGSRVRNTTPLERAVLFDINHIITSIKSFIDFTYQNGLKSKDLAEINETMRSLSLAGMSLTRLISIHDQYISSPLPRDFPADSKRILDVVEYYKKKLAPIADLSGIDTSYFTDR
jgi:hypothetical protein